METTREPLVSIITPVFNGERFLAETLDSVAAQSHTSWEHILVDDGSTDNSSNIVSGFAALDPRFRLIPSQGNRGALAARNTGLREARGRYVCFLDADDLWHKQKLERQLAFMHERDAAISHTGYRRMSAETRQLGPPILPPERMTYADLLGNTAIAMSTGMIDTARFGQIEIDENGPRSLRSDLRFWLARLREGEPAYGLREDLAIYRVVPQSLSSSPWRSAYWVWRIYRDYERLSLFRAGMAFSSYASRALKKRLGSIRRNW